MNNRHFVFLFWRQFNIHYIIHQIFVKDLSHSSSFHFVFLLLCQLQLSVFVLSKESRTDSAKMERRLKVQFIFRVCFFSQTKLDFRCACDWYSSVTREYMFWDVCCWNLRSFNSNWSVNSIFNSIMFWLNYVTSCEKKWFAEFEMFVVHSNLEAWSSYSKFFSKSFYFSFFKANSCKSQLKLKNVSNPKCFSF